MRFLENTNFDWMGLLNFHERPFRAKLIPSKVWRDLDYYRNDSLGLVNYFKKWRTRIEWRDTPKGDTYKSYLAVGGEYDPEDRQITIHIYTKKYNQFVFTPDSWVRFKMKLMQVLMHELIHFMQYDRRYDEWSNYVLPHKTVGHVKKDAERRYLSEFDEIQAYAHCIYLDYKMGKPNVPVHKLVARSKKCRTDSRTFNYILKVFDYDYRNNHAIPKIMQQIIKWDRKYQRASRRPK